MNDLSSEARNLLDSASGGDDPSAEDRRRVWRTLGAVIATGAVIAATTRVATAAGTSSAGAAVPAAASAGKLVAWLGVGLVAGLATTGAAVLVSRATTPAAVVAPSHALPETRPRSVSPASPAIALAEAAEDAPVIEADPATPAVRAPEPHAAAPAPTPATPAPASSLGAETSLLESARAALGRGDARDALALLAVHERAFPAGALVEERLASKVFALCGLGRRAEAAQAAAELLRRAPGSPLRSRVLESCAYRP